MNEKLSLSAAIRLGAMLKPQGFGTIYDGSRTCAFGAAYDAIGILEKLYDEFKRGVHPVLSEEGQNQKYYDFTGWEEGQNQKYYDFTGWKVWRANCPECGQSAAFLAITHLNDVHRWTRERIADWVQPIEESLTLESVEPAERVTA